MPFCHTSIDYVCRCSFSFREHRFRRPSLSVISLAVAGGRCSGGGRSCEAAEAVEFLSGGRPRWRPRGRCLPPRVMLPLPPRLWRRLPFCVSAPAAVVEQIHVSRCRQRPLRCQSPRLAIGSANAIRAACQLRSAGHCLLELRLLLRANRQQFLLNFFVLRCSLKGEFHHTRIHLARGCVVFEYPLS